jgi:lycopene beta-cyclase
VETIAIVGGGAAGLSFGYYLAKSTNRRDLRCIIIDPDEKRDNDRTWAFWGDAFDLDELVAHRWSRIALRNGLRTVVSSSAGYRFIPADAFYSHCLSTINNDPRFELLPGRVEKTTANRDSVTILLRRRSHTGFQPPEELTVDYAVDSVFGPPAGPEAQSMQQSFVGWEVESREPLWDPEIATLMEFTPEHHADGLGFFYTLPRSTTHALVEYTVVSPTAPEGRFLEEHLNNYMESLGAGEQWTVRRTEKGTIPLFEHRTPGVHGRILHLGVAAGAARPSTGYAFRGIVESARAVAEAFAEHGDWLSLTVPTAHATRRARFYDAVFLEMLRGEPHRMPEALCDLFHGTDSERVFRFLRGKSSLLDEAIIILSLPWRPFLRALFRRSAGARRFASMKAWKLAAPALQSARAEKPYGV